jgi:hypothetical protein
MKLNMWTLALASAGDIGSGIALQAEEQYQVMTTLSQTVPSGYVHASTIVLSVLVAHVLLSALKRLARRLSKIVLIIRWK